MSGALADLPDFLGIGAVKAGTTWLHRWLRAHPDLYLPAQKPVYYFDKHYPAKPLERYAGLFRPGRGRVRGEITASYSVLPAQTIAAIRTAMPALRLVLLLREPRSRAWSEARMEFSLLQGRPIEQVGEAELVDFLGSSRCRERGDYPAILRRWRAAFAPERLFVGFYDDVRYRPEWLLGQVYVFLGVAPDGLAGAAGLHERVFESPRRPMPDACRRLLDGIYGEPFLRELAGELGHELPAAWSDGGAGDE